MTVQKQSFIEKAKNMLKENKGAISRIGLTAGGIASFAFIITAPIMIVKDRTCTLNGKVEACSFDMKWAKSRLSCVLQDGKTVITRPLCTRGGSDCVPGYHSSGSPLQGNIKFEITPSKGRWKVLLEENGLRSETEVPACK